MTAPEQEAHTLGPAAIHDGIVTVSCSCGGWGQRWQESPLAPGWLDVQHAHRMHAQASDRARLTPPQFPPGAPHGLDDLIAAARAMAEQAETAADALQGFVDAHTAARQNGVGVLITRAPGGTISSTPNVYLAPGVVVYTDDPGAPWNTAPVKFPDARAPFEPATGWLPRYNPEPPPLHDVA